MCPYIPTYVLQTQYFGCIYHTFDLLGITNQRQKNRQKIMKICLGEKKHKRMKYK